MSGEWPEGSGDFIPFEQLQSVKRISANSGHARYAAILSAEGKREPVTLTVLTVEGEASKQKFIQEAALLKLLNQKNLPQFVGVCLAPNQASRHLKYPSNLAYITKNVEEVTLERYFTDLEEELSRWKSFPYATFLDIFIDIADTLHYLHSRKPKVIHRGISAASIKISTANERVSTQLSDFRNAILTPEKGHRVARLGMDSFQQGSLASEEILSMDFFKSTLMPQETINPSPSRPPLSPSAMEPPSPKPRPLSRTAIVSTQSSQNKRADSRSVSFNQEVTMLGSRNTSSSFGSSLNNQTTPDPEHQQKVGLQKIVHVKQGVYVESENAAQSLKSRELEKQQKSQRKSKTKSRDGAESRMSGTKGGVTKTAGHGGKEISESGKKQNHPKAHSNNHDALTTETSLSNVAAGGGAQVDPIDECGSLNVSQKSVITSLTATGTELDSSSSPSWNKARTQSQEEALFPFNVMVEASEISVTLHDKVPDIAKPEAQAQPPLSATPLPIDEEETKNGELNIYREDSMVYLKRQAGVHLPPEIHEGKAYDTSVDIFNLGLVIYRVMTRQTPTFLTKRKGIVRFSFPANFPKDVETLIMHCCKADAEQRPNAEQVAAQLRIIKELGSLNVLNKRWKIRKFLCFCGSP